VPAGLGIIAYGKLGGKELGYGSDLDIVFVYEPALAQGLKSHYPRLVQRLISWLSLNTSAGRLFEIDTALRPNGQAGLMLTTMTSFAQYQLGQDAGTHAWLWEHQALSRARLCAGDTQLAAPFEALRSQVLCLPREQEILKKEVREMRQKVSQGHPVPDDTFDAKHSAGGMVDVEFAVQYLVLRYAADHTALQGNVGNVALLRAAAQAGLISYDTAEQVGQGYMALRTAQHQCKLQDESHVWFKRGSPQAQALQGFTSTIAALCAAFASAT
jgi:glutamate-ammonia-ligase adenylyltransferase